MPIEYKKNRASFLGMVSVDDAEGLLEWLQKKPSATADLTECIHLHPADLQVLLAAETRIAAWPKDAELRAWLETVLKSE